MSEYQSAGGSLKLKGGVSKKHKKSKKNKKLEKLQAEEAAADLNEAEVSRPKKGKMTKAEQEFEDAKKMKQDKEFLKKAQKTHKERILEFNEALDNLSEHYDIPKVSWTK